MKERCCAFIFLQQDGSCQYHLGSSYIIAHLRKNGINACQFICSNGNSLNGLVNRILAAHPFCVGFSCFDSNYFMVKELISGLKKKSPSLLTLAGGPTATFSDIDIMRDSCGLDLCVRGEGEESVLELISRYRKNGGLYGVKGITFRNGLEIIRNPDRPLLEDLDQIPSPYLSGVLDPSLVYKINGEIPLLTGRGCIFQCIYCNFSSMFGHTIRHHSVKRVTEELKLISSSLKSVKGDKVALQDDLFTLDKKRVNDICERILEAGLELKFSFLTRPDLVDKKMLELLYSAGFKHVKFGLESSSLEVLYNIKKIRNPRLTHDSVFSGEKRFLEKLCKAMRHARRIGFESNISVIFGLPKDTRKKALQTLDFVRKLNPTTYSHNFLNIYTGTPIFSGYKRWKLKMPPLKFKQILRDPVLNPVNYAYNVYKLPRLHNDLETLNLLNTTEAIFSRMIMGVYTRARKSPGATDILVAAKKIPVEWMRGNLSIGSSFIFGKGLLSLRSKKLKNNPIAFLTNTSSFIHPKYRHFSVASLEAKVLDNFKRFYSIVDLKDYSGKNKKYIYRISSQDDLHKFESFLGFPETAKGLLILDSCRWHKSCPARSLRRLVITGNNRIYPCFSGRCLARGKESLTKISKKLDLLMKKIRKKRGCTRCRVKQVCSKCIYLDRIPPEEYCRIKRGLHPERFIESLYFTHKLTLTKGQEW